MTTSRTCSRCNGKGKIVKEPCAKCRGTGKQTKRKKLDVTIPAGIDDRQIVNVRGEGNKGVNGGPAGDLLVAVFVRPHPFFERDGYDVWCDVTVSFTQAALGDTLQVPTLDGKVKYDLPAGTQPGTVFKLKARGIQNLHGRSKGDQLIRVLVEVPKNLNSKQKDLLKELEKELGKKNTDGAEEGGKGFFGKKKK